MHRFTWLFTALVTTTLVSGCASVKPPTEWFGEKEEEIEYGTPAKVVAIWTNSVLNRADGPSVRGLGGRVYFYDGEHKPVRVNGQLAVFLYDDSHPGADHQEEATKVVRFTTDEVAGSFAPTEFGASYSFWVPWDEVGGERTQLSVIPVFTEEKGMMLVGEQARHLLPGREIISPELELTTEIAQASGIAEIGGAPGANVAHASGTEAGKLDVETTTIKLPPTMQRRVRQKPPRRQMLFGRRSSSVFETSSMINRLEDLEQRAGAKATSEVTSPEPQDSEPSAHSPLGQLRAQTSPFSQRESDPARLPLVRGGSLFDRSR